MTEFVIVIPVLLLLLLGILQITLLSVDRFKLAVVEREVMLFVAGNNPSDAEVAGYAKKIAEKNGLDTQRLKVRFVNGTIAGKKIDTPEWLSNFGPVKHVFGKTTELSYKSEFLSSFSKITGTEGIMIKTTINGAYGGSWSIPENVAKTVNFGDWGSE